MWEGVLAYVHGAPLCLALHPYAPEPPGAGCPGLDPTCSGGHGLHAVPDAAGWLRHACPAQYQGSGVSPCSGWPAAQPAAQLSYWYSSSEPPWHERGSASPTRPHLHCWLRPSQGDSAGKGCPVAQREAQLQWQEGSSPFWDMPAAASGPLAPHCFPSSFGGRSGSCRRYSRA